MPNGDRGECGLRLSAENIVGGSVAKIGEFPYMALFGYDGLNNQTFYLCGGAIVNAKYILTAAHCHDDKNPIKLVHFTSLHSRSRSRFNPIF